MSEPQQPNLIHALTPVVSLIVMLGMSSGPIFAGLMADLYGDYELGLSILAGLSLLGAFCFLAAVPPAPRTREVRATPAPGG